MIKMQMRIDDNRHVLRGGSRQSLHGFSQRPLSIDAVHRAILIGPLVADACFDQHAFVSGVNEQTIHAHANPILAVRWAELGPKITRNNSEHCPAIKSKFAIGHDLDAIISELHRESELVLLGR